MYATNYHVDEPAEAAASHALRLVPIAGQPRWLQILTALRHHRALSRGPGLKPLSTHVPAPPPHFLQTWETDGVRGPYSPQ